MFNRLLASKKRPCFQHAPHWDTLKLDLSGCQFQITLPPQDYEFPEEKRGTRFNLFDESWYTYEEKPGRDDYPASRAGVPGVLTRKWFTYGAIWREESLGVLQCNAVICDTSRMDQDLDCFNPEQFERILLHSLYYSYGPGAGAGRNEYKAPVNWQIKRVADTEWIYYESWSQKPEWIEGETPRNYDTRFTAWASAPLFKDKYLLIRFSSVGGGWGRLAQPSNELMFSRINAIIPGLRLQLAPEAARQQRETRRQHPHSRYSPTREPENWRYYGSYREGNFLADEKPIVFEGACSPPPELY